MAWLCAQHPLSTTTGTRHPKMFYGLHRQQAGAPDLHACRQTPMHIKQNEKTDNGKPCKNKHIKCVYSLCIISSWLSPIQDVGIWPCSTQLTEACQIQCQCRRTPCHELLFQFIANMIKIHYTTYMKFSKYIFKQNNKIPDGKNLNVE